ncbi:MAG: aldo/keto reductase [Deltaproteobacteria bacterium]|nr:MAG: aldo/keto reductase [Deltaproteobacteria bacterium]
MKQITLGKTGLCVTRLGFGGIPIQRVDEEQAVETVRHAVKRGVDFIDTSRAYTTSERRIGLALKNANKRIILASKSVSRTAKDLRKDLETSLKNLQREYIDLYQCHFVKNADDYQQIISSGGALEALVKAKEEGLIGHIGLTSHSLDLIEHALDDNIFETIMVCFSLLEPAAGDKIIPKAIDKQVGVIAMKTFSGGVLDNPQLALKYVLSYPGIALIPGVEHKNLFDANWKVFQSSWKLNNDEKNEIEIIRQRYDKIFCRRCDYCQPCSEDIPIQSILGLRYAVKRFGNAVLEKNWMKDGIKKARQCSACEECMERCPYNLPIPDLIQENLKWLDERG